MISQNAIKLAQLRFFCAVVDEGSVVAASRRMNCVASNITARLHELEAMLGQDLFQRAGGRLLPSPAGRLLYREARPLLDNVADLINIFATQEPIGLLSVGALDVAFAGYLAARLPAFIGRNRSIELKLLQRPSYELERMLFAGKLDVIPTDGPICHPILDSRFAFDEALHLVIPATIDCVDDIDWSRMTVFLFNTDCFYRSRFEAWLKAREFRPASIRTMESYPLICACVQAGLGVSCFPSSMLPPDDAVPAGVKLLHPTDLVSSPVYFVWRRESVTTPLSIFVHELAGSCPDESATANAGT